MTACKVPGTKNVFKATVSFSSHALLSEWCFSQQMWFLCIHYLTSKQRNWIPHLADLGLMIASLWQVLHVFLKKLEPSVKVPSLLNPIRLESLISSHVCRPHFHTTALATILQWNDFLELLNPRRGRSRPSQLHSPSSCNFIKWIKFLSPVIFFCNTSLIWLLSESRWPDLWWKKPFSCMWSMLLHADF